MIDVNRFFGDVVIYEGNDLEDKVIKYFTKDFTHAAIRTSRKDAHSIRYGKEKHHDLIHPRDGYNRYLILEHKNMISIRRKWLKQLHEIVNKDYDLELIFKLGLRKLFRIEPNEKDLSIKRKFTCSSRIAYLYNRIKLPISDDIHWSQIEPRHFYESPYFEVVKELNWEI